VKSSRLRRIRALAEKLKSLPQLDEAERLLYAEHLVMTPDERWLRNFENVRSLKAMELPALKSLIRKKEASGRATDLAQVPMLRDLLAQREGEGR
jgi:hypothetical protein